MDSGSSSSSMLFVGTAATTDNMEVVTNSQKESLDVHAQNDHPLASNNQTDQPEASNPKERPIVIRVSIKTLLDQNRYLCEVCFKGFPRQQNLSLHKRVHNLPFTLKAKKSNEPAPKRVYVCPHPPCPHHNPSQPIGDFGGLKKHYLRKHCKNYKIHKCETCDKAYSVESDWKAHSKVCSKRNHGYHHGNPLSRSNSFTSINQQTFDTENGPERSTANNNINIPLGSSMSYPQTFGMEDMSRPQAFGVRDVSHPQTLRMGHLSHPQTFFGMGNVSQTFGMGNMSDPQAFGTGHMSHPQTFVMSDNTINTYNNNENNNTLTGPQGWSIQNQSNSYQSQLSHFGADHSSLVTDTSTGLINYNQIPQNFFPPMSSHDQSQQGNQQYYDIGFYASLLKNEIQSDNVNNEDMNLMGDGVNVYGTGEGFQVDNPAMHNVNSNGMVNYDQGSYNMSYGFESGNLNYRGGNEVLSLEDQQVAPGGSQAPSEARATYSNQQRFLY